MARGSGQERDYYRVLGVSPEATEDEIRKAYRRLALQWHPDRNPGHPEAAEQFRTISEAYAVLIDGAKRRQYDRARQTGPGGDFRVDRDDLFRDLFADPRASAVFDELAREFARLGLRIDHRVFHQTLFGGRAVVTGGVFVISPFTLVRGLFGLARVLRGATAPPGAPWAEPALAPDTLGRRLLRAGRRLLGLSAGESSGGLDVTFPLTLTRTEATEGGRRRLTLTRADGADEVAVTIPPGIRAGTRLRLRGKGRTAPGRPAGDAYLVVEITDEPETRRS